MRFRPLSYAAAAAILLASGVAQAQQYSFQYYGVDQGLNDLAVRTLFQDSQGFIWLGTETGIFRYDGTRFQAFGPNEGAPVSNAVMFGEAPDGRLIVGGGFGLYRQTGEKFEAVSMPAKGVTWGAGIRSNGRGSTYLATEAGLLVMKMAGGRYRFDPQPTPPHTGGQTAAGVLVDREAVWWGCGDELCEAQKGSTRVYGPSQGLPASRWRGIQRAGNGDVWVQSKSGTVAVMHHGEAHFTVTKLPGSRFGPRGPLAVDRWGNMIAPIGDGLVMQKDGAWNPVGRREGLYGPVYAALQDREGTIWLGLGGHGLARWLGYRQWEHFNADSGLGGELAYQVAPGADGSFWVGTDSGLYKGRMSEGEWTWRKEPRLGDIPVHSVRPDPQGRLWLGTESRGAARLDPKTGSLEWFDKRTGLTAESPYTILPDSKHRIWAGTLTGLFVTEPDKLQFHPVTEVPTVMCLALMESPDGTIWAGTALGLFEFSNGHWRRFTTEDGLSQDEILSLTEDEHGDIFVGYQYGAEIDRIQRHAGELRISRVGGQTGQGVTYFLGFDAGKRLWAGTNRGVYVKDGETWRHYGHGDGLVWDDCDLNGFTPMPDGSVWVGTSGGLARFTPREDVVWKDPPVAIFTKLTLGGNNVSQDVSVPYNSNALAVRFSSLSFARQDRILFRYRIAPLFSDWRETTQHELQFPGLSPDSYRLEVEARDGWGRWSARPAVFGFEVRPPWWRSGWFVSLLAGALVGIVVLIIMWRGRAARQRERRLVRLVDERTAELKKANGTLRETTIKLQEANQYLVRLSTIDGLTGIANRRMFDQTLQAEWLEAQRTGIPLSVILVDIDHFKWLNDSAGHLAGDDCLKRIAGELARTLKRESDLVARYGGEEFALILPLTDGSHAAELAESIRSAVEDLRIAHSNSPTGPVVTISLGIATMTGDNFVRADELLGAADSALYSAKQRGRNRAESFCPALNVSSESVADDLGRISLAQPDSEHTFTI